MPPAVHTQAAVTHDSKHPYEVHGDAAQLKASSWVYGVDGETYNVVTEAGPNPDPSSPSGAGGGQTNGGGGDGAGFIILDVSETW